MTRLITWRITSSDANTTLLDLLTRRFTYHTRDAWLARISSGRVRVDDLPAVPDLLLQPGMTLRYDASDIPEPPVDTALTILHQTSDFIAVNKPGNLPCHPAGRYFDNTLWALLKRDHAIPEPLLINRLDRETSGLCLVARNPATGVLLRNLFATRRVKKTYLVIVHGAFPEALTATGHLAPDPSSAIRKKLRFTPCASADANTQAATFCETHFRRLAFNASDCLSFLEARPLTGRTHQIRATLCSLGFPLLGDKLYGPDETLFLRFCDNTLTPTDIALLRLPRQALHAHTLDLPLATPLHLCAPLPADMAAIFPRAPA